MDENEIDRLADEFFEPFETYAYGFSSLNDALSLAEVLETRFSTYAEGIRDDLRRGRS